MRHDWEHREIPEGESFVNERCSRCGVVRWRYPAGGRRYTVDGLPASRVRPECLTPDSRFNEINRLAAILNRSLVFMEMVPGVKNIHQSKKPLYEQFRIKHSARPKGTGLSQRSVLQHSASVPPDRGMLLPGLRDDAVPHAHLEAPAAP